MFGTISLSCELFSLLYSCFAHVGPAQLCIGNVVSFTCVALMKLHGYHRILAMALQVCDCLYWRFGVSSE